MDGSLPKLYNAWFCPFAQRAWIAMLAKKAEFEYIEQNPYNKTPEWLAINPNGLVPVIVHNGNAVYESSICIEFIDEAFSTPVTILPKDPYKRAHGRMWGDFVSKKLVPHFYTMLLKQDKEDQEEAKTKYLEGLRTFTNEMDPEGPFFQGKHLGYVDIMWAPFAARMHILEHYRGFSVPQTDEFKRYHHWWDIIKRHSAVANTLQDEEKMLQVYQRYAFNTTRSQVSEAIRKGTALP
ncbi:predicted protein [Nematostella vectensis]|uniref:Glutathione S-transferase omega n=1 Tax=Nematostella vectensis TaxID=45351 RepID=A7RJG9_NEMVE|nr:predicted protein [Nematostella vectensis]|eukprot:XP_001640438.1 predicted protein [Nematostella vectensis]